MADLSQMTDDQLLELYQQEVAKQGRAADTGRNAPGGPVMADTKTDQEALETARGKARKSLETARMAEQFMQLNSRTGTGGLPSRPVVPLTKAIPGAPLWGDLAASLTGNPDWSQMKSINSQLAPAQRVPGSGASSDMDVKMFKEALPNIDTPGPANAMNAKRLQKQSDRDNAYAAFQDTWYSRNGTLLGADKAFNQFWLKRESGDPVANNISAQDRALAAVRKAGAKKPAAPAASRAKILSVEPD